MTEELTKVSEMGLLANPTKDTEVMAIDTSVTPKVSKRMKLENGLATAVSYRDLLVLNDVPDSPGIGVKRTFMLDDGFYYYVDPDGNVTQVGSGSLPHVCQGRLTLSSGNPDSLTEIRGATTVYFAPFNGNLIRLYDTGSAAWKYFDLSELSWPTTNNQTGDLVNGSAQVSDLDTSLLVVGMEVTAVGVPVGATVVSIDSATVITLSAAATEDANDRTITFEAPASAKYDLFVKISGSEAVLRRPVAWTNVSTRSVALTDQDGVKVLSGEAGSLYIGTVLITGTTGELEDSSEFRSLENLDSSFRPWLLEKSSGVTVSLPGGWLSGDEKQAATWTITKSGGSWNTPSNLYDGSDSTVLNWWNQNSVIYAKVDFGVEIALDQVKVRVSSSSAYRPDNIEVYISSTGSFSGEETKIGDVTTGASSTETVFSFGTAQQSRYWMIKFWGNDSGNMGEVNELHFYSATTLLMYGVPMGCKVELWDGSTSLESKISENLTLPGRVDFSAAVTDVDKITITRPDGSTDWLAFDGLNLENGDILTLIKE